MVLWVYTDTAKLYLFPTSRTDTVGSVQDFLSRAHKFSQKEYDLAILTPGLAYPVLLKQSNVDLYSGVILCLPTNDIRISIETKEHEHFNTVVHPLDTIEDIKCHIHDMRGYPMDIQDLMLNGHVLRNNESVVDYQMSSDSRMFLILQPYKKFAIHVDTFWGVKYTVEAGLCTSVQNVIQMILRKSMRNEDEASEFHTRIFMRDKLMYEGLIKLETANTVLKDNLCLGYYGISKGTNLRLTSTGEAQKDNSRMVQVLLENGVTVHTNAAKYDNWYIVALKLHGITGKPVDMMRLYANDYPVEFNCTVGTLKQNNDVIHAKLATLRSPSHSVGFRSNAGKSLCLEVKTINGVLETIHCSSKDSIHDLKLHLERVGVPEAKYCDVLYKKVKLPSNSKLMDYKLVNRTHMELKMGEFPVEVISATNTVKLTAQSEAPMSELLASIEAKTGASPIKAAITFGGRNLYDCKDMIVQNSALYVNSTIHVESLQASRILHIVTGDDVVPLPIQPNMDSLHFHQLTHLHHYPEVFLKSLNWFLKWRFPSMKISNYSSASRSDTPTFESSSQSIGSPVPSRSKTMGRYDLPIQHPKHIVQQRSQTMPLLSVMQHAPRRNLPNSHSFDLNELNHNLDDPGRTVINVQQNEPATQRETSMGRLNAIANGRDSSLIREHRTISHDRSSERGSVSIDTAGRPSGRLYLPNIIRSYTDELSSPVTASSSSGSPRSIKSPEGSGASYNGWSSRSEPNASSRSPSVTPDSTPASKKKLQVRFELPAENGSGDDRSPPPVRSALKKSSKSGSPRSPASRPANTAAHRYGMTLSSR